MTTGATDSADASAAAHGGWRAAFTVDLSAIAANWRALDRLGPAETAAAVKADAYGLGAAAVAPALRSAGARTFFTATEDEAADVARALGPGADVVVFVLNGFAPADRPPDPRIRPVLSSPRDVAVWRDVRTPVALQLETGMNRLGLLESEVEALLAGPPPAFEPALLMSHLATADDAASPQINAQKARFDAHLARLRPRFPAARASLSATGGARLGPDLAYDLVRPGIGLFGGAPFAAKPVARLEAPLLRVWSVKRGETSGYGAAWRAARPSRLATIPLGYADGLPRSLGGRGEARIGGRIVPFAGRVSMDLIVLDVTDATPELSPDLSPELGPGATAVLLDETLTIDRMAAAAGTIGYEILTGLGARVGRRGRRRYVGA